jgi:ATP-binding cassette subfamily C (CFTR/MRP) protein 1
VYVNADILLLDDPISALDTATSKKVFQQVIRGTFKGKTTILATHAVHFFHLADKIIVLENGKVSGFGTFDELKNTSYLSEILANNAKTRKETMDAAKNETAGEQ